MRIAMTGASGLVGGALSAALVKEGHSLLWLKRNPRFANAVGHAFWDPAAGMVPADRLEGCDVVINFAGATIGRRWTPAVMREIRESRIRGTEALSRALSTLDRPPRLFLSGSAVGYYGYTSRYPMDEASPPGTGFLAEIARAWEEATLPAAEVGIRVVNTRLAMVLAPNGGALERMLPIFRAGLGGRLGSGRQPWSWISIDDIPPAVLHVMADERLRGPVNFAAPETVSNAEFTRALARVLGRPAMVAAPAFALRLRFGGMADEMLLNGVAVVPRRLLDSGYQFRAPTLEPALRTLLGRGV